MWKQRVLLTGMAAVAGLPAFAGEDEVGHWYVVPQVGYTFGDDRRGIDDDLGYGLGIGGHISPSWSLEFNVNLTRLDGQGDGAANKTGVDGQDLDLIPLSIDALRVFNRNGRVSPYVTFGVGTITNASHDTDKTRHDFMSQAGLGLLWHVWQNSEGTRAFNLRPEVKARWDDTGSSGHQRDYLAGLGFEFSFGGSKAAPPPPPPPPPPAEPAPAPEPVAAPAPADTDGDGVFDDKDLCPDTPRGVAVDANGCPRKGKITLTGVNFETNSATLTGSSLAVLDEIAEDLAKYRRLKVELQGHTDSTGADAYNLKLSDRRANAVREYLVGHGVGAEQLTAKGYGEAEPVADNTTADGRAQNRRVAMNVLENPGDVEVKNVSAPK